MNYLKHHEQLNSKMMRLFKTSVFLVFVFIQTTTWATTWDEPWQDAVIKQADVFVLAKMISSDEEKGLTIEIINTLGGSELKGKIKVTDFYLLYLCSTSEGHGPEFNFEGVEECYFFLKKNEKGNYSIATPTAGFANIVEGSVYATYRHTYHQALVDPEVYEKTMTAIFNNYHGQSYDKKYISDYVDKYLSLDPAGFAEDEINTFFGQHVALECAYHLGLTEYYAKILPFLADTSNFHNEVSAARALVSYNTAECKQQLISVVSDTTRGHFLQVICIRTLSEFKPTELKEQLVKVNETASSEHTGFGGSIMDPRVCTHIPDVKYALEQLIQDL